MEIREGQVWSSANGEHVLIADFASELDKHWWLYSEDETKPQYHRMSEEEIEDELEFTGFMH